MDYFNNTDMFPDGEIVDNHGSEFGDGFPLRSSDRGIGVSDVLAGSDSEDNDENAYYNSYYYNNNYRFGDNTIYGGGFPQTNAQHTHNNNNNNNNNNHNNEFIVGGITPGVGKDYLNINDLHTTAPSIGSQQSMCSDITNWTDELTKKRKILTDESLDFVHYFQTLTMDDKRKLFVHFLGNSEIKSQINTPRVTTSLQVEVAAASNQSGANSVNASDGGGSNQNNHTHILLNNMDNNNSSNIFEMNKDILNCKKLEKDKLENAIEILIKQGYENSNQKAHYNTPNYQPINSNHKNDKKNKNNNKTHGGSGSSNASNQTDLQDIVCHGTMDNEALQETKRQIHKIIRKELAKDYLYWDDFRILDEIIQRYGKMRGIEFDEPKPLKSFKLCYMAYNLCHGM